MMTGAESQAEQAPSLVGRVIDGKYRITRLCGQGGMGSVYEAQHVQIGKRLALKFIDPQRATDRDSIQRFVREAQAASAVESLHIVQVFDAGETSEGHPYLVMELLQGQTLGSRIEQAGRLDFPEALLIVEQTLRGLHRAHQQGIVHRDLKPENIFLVQHEDEPLVAKILDFGISKIIRRAGALDPGTLTQRGIVLGTPYYMAPEQAQGLGDLDARADLWSVGAILFECLTGQRPFSGTTYEQVIVTICTVDAPDIRSFRSDVPEALALVIRKALARDRTYRFGTAKEFLQALRAATPTLAGSHLPSFESDPSLHPSGPSTPAQLTPARQGSTPKAAIEPPQTGAPLSTSASRLVANKKRSPWFLLSFGLVLGAVSFVGTLLWIRPSRTSPNPAGAPAALIESPSGQGANKAWELRVVSNAAGAQVFVDGQVQAEPLVRGTLGSAHRVRVEAPGFGPWEEMVWLQDSQSEMHVELTTQSGASPSASTGAGKPKTERVPAAPSPAHSNQKNPSGVASGLQLKTDIP